MRRTRTFLAILTLALLCGAFFATMAGASDIPYGADSDPEGITYYYPDRDSAFGQFVVDWCFFYMGPENQGFSQTAMAEMDADTSWGVTYYDAGCANGTHDDAILTEWDFDCDGISPTGGSVPACGPYDQSTKQGSAGCLSSVFGVCDQTLVKIDYGDIITGTGAEPGGYTIPHYDWNFEHVLRHEVGHVMGLHHSSASGVCGPAGAYQYVGTFSAVGPNYPCGGLGVYENIYNPQRHEFNTAEWCNINYWEVWGANAASGVC